MARGGKAKKKEEGEEEANLTNPETIERKRLKSLAISHNILSETPARSSVQLNPSSVVAKHHGKDIIKKSQRKSSRYLFSFPGLIAPIAGGKIGDLKDLGTKNPVLYLDFPQVAFLSAFWDFECKLGFLDVGLAWFLVSGFGLWERQIWFLFFSFLNDNLGLV